jgi:outer membrane protein assembly factor BamB
MLGVGGRLGRWGIEVLRSKVLRTDVEDGDRNWKSKVEEEDRRTRQTEIWHLELGSMELRS